MALSLPGFLKKTIFFLITMLICISGCSGDHHDNQKKANRHLATDDKQMGTTYLLLTYIDSIAKLPLEKFNLGSVTSLNKTFLGKLPLAIYNGKAHNEEKNVVIQYYKNTDTTDTVKGRLILLIPKHITDSLRIADFTSYFGSIKKEKPMISIPEQPLPVRINVSAGTSIKLTYNNNEKLDLAQVIMVEVLKYK